MLFKIGDTVTLANRPDTKFKVFHTSNGIVQVECTLTCLHYLSGVYYNFHFTHLQFVDERSIEQRIILKIEQLEIRHALYLKKKYSNKVNIGYA